MMTYKVQVAVRSHQTWKVLGQDHPQWSAINSYDVSKMICYLH